MRIGLTRSISKIIFDIAETSSNLKYNTVPKSVDIFYFDGKINRNDCCY